MSLEIKAYERQPDEQFSAFLNTVYNSSKAFESAGVELLMGNDCSYRTIGKKRHIIKSFKEHYEEYYNQNCFVSINYFNPFISALKSEVKRTRSNKSLWSIDHIMIDIDSVGENQNGCEDMFIERYLAEAEQETIPLFNAFSYSGSGGIHLYFCFQSIHKNSKNVIKAFSFKLAEMIQLVVDSLEKDGVYYKIDTKVFATLANDRVPGSINPKTGRMCEFFSTNVERYNLSELMSFVQNSGYEWVDYEEYQEEKERKRSVKRAKREKAKAKRGKKDYTQNQLVALGLSRIKSLFKLAESGYDFRSHRETSAFYLRCCCETARYTEEETENALLELNQYFYKPLSEHELLYTTQLRGTVYKFTNERAAVDYLGIDVDSDEYRIAFPHTKVKPLLNGKQEKMALRFQSIAKLKNDNPGIMIKDIADKLHITKDQVKRVNAALNRDMSGYLKWLNVDLVTDAEWIKDYLKTHLNINRKSSKKSVKERTSSEQTVSDTKDRPNPVLTEEQGIMTKIKLQHESKRLGKDADLVNEYILNVPTLLRLEKLRNFIKTHEKRRLKRRFIRSVKKQYRQIVEDIYSDKTIQGSLAINWIEKKMLEWGLDENFVHIIIHGYTKYSEEYCEERNLRYLSDDIPPEIPLPNIEPVYADRFEKFPELIDYETVYFSPKAILHNYFSCFDDDKINCFIPSEYISTYFAVRRRIEAFRYQKKIYDRNAKCSGYKEANKAVMYAQELNNEIYTLLVEYHKKAESFDFSAIDITRQIKRKLIAAKKNYRDYDPLIEV